MKVLVIESDADLGALWTRHLERLGNDVILAPTEKEAIDRLRFVAFDVLVLDITTKDASVLAISDFATYRNPDVAIIIVTANSFFSDGSIFELIPNARGYLHSPIKPDDLAALVEHYGRNGKQEIA
ncbi:MAG: response regulator [Amylibacter sp.]|jgi:DNA-binding NtrC family response regulator|nr:response regulator [Amylibacter sp.]